MSSLKDFEKKDFIEGIRKADRRILSRAITMIESSREEDHKLAHEILEELMVKTGESIRIGITGVPGAGKSTLIESLGISYCKQGKKVAVLAIDPSSKCTGGSILGDKTRMEKLSREENAFIRPSPSGGTGGGVALRTREAMLLCEAAGFDIILIETVGVGQGETELRNLVDFFVLLMITGAGDELQSIKKGIIELSDAVVVNKADGGNETEALNLAEEFRQIFHYLPSYNQDWPRKALAVSAVTEAGLDELEKLVAEFVKETKKTGAFPEQRQKQIRTWLQSLLEERILNRFLPTLENDFDKVMEHIQTGELSVNEAVDSLLSKISE